MSLDAAPRVISLSSFPLQAVLAAAGKAGEMPAAPAAALRRPPPSPGTKQSAVPPAAGQGVRGDSYNLQPRSPKHYPKAEREPKEPEGETAERGAEKGAGVRIYVCVAWGRPDHL